VKKQFHWCFPILCILILLAACVPYSFSPPTQIHINPGDHVTEPVIAVDAVGRLHIAGAVGGHLVYYRTTFGDPKETLTMTMTGSGPLWEQYGPDIAATDAGTAWLVWTEQWGDANKIACYRVITPLPPEGGYSTNCLRLDSIFFSAGNVMVVARGSKVYALYDAIDVSGGIGALWYKELSHPANTGVIYPYSVQSESGHLYSWDAGIDNQGYLHVAILDNDGHGKERLFYCSNTDIYEDGTMKRFRFIVDSVLSNNLEENTAIDLDFYMSGMTEIVAISSVFETDSKDAIWIDTCDVPGCGVQASFKVPLPSVWSTQSVIKDVEMVSTGTTLRLGFIGDSSETSYSQVYYKANALSSDFPVMFSENRSTQKRGLGGVKVDPRPQSPLSISFSAFSWGEIDFDTIEYYSYDGYVSAEIYNTSCLTSQVGGESASNGVYHSGVWRACGDTWFTTQAEQFYLPVISK